MTDKITEARRAKFEAHYSDINLERSERWPDFYVNLPTRMCWEVWQAALDSVVVELPDAWRSAGSTHELMCKRQTIEAINAAGVRTK